MKKFCALLLVAMIPFSFSACGGGSSAAPKDATAPAETKQEPAAADAPAADAASASGLSGNMTYWSGFSGDSMKWDEWRVAEFMKENPDIKVEVQFVPEAAGIRNGKLLAAIAGGTAPDVLVADDYISAYGFAGQGAFEAWDPYLKDIDLSADQFMPGFKNLMQYKGETYLLPQDSNVIMLFMNTDMLEEAGLDPANPPKTITELDDWAEKLTVKEADGTISRYGFIPWLDSGDDPFTWPFMFGAETYDPDTNKLDLADASTVDALNWMREYAKKYDPVKIKGFTQSAGGLFSPDHPFFTSRVAMTTVGNWATNALKIYAPDIHYTCVAIPVPAGGRVDSTPLGSNVFAMPKGTKNPQLATAFFKFTQKAEINGDNFDTWRSIPTVDKVFDDVSWIKSGDPIYTLERKLANSPKSGHPALCAVSTQMRSDMKALRDEVIYSDKDPVPLLKALQEKLQPELDK